MERAVQVPHAPCDRWSKLRAQRESFQRDRPSNMAAMPTMIAWQSHASIFIKMFFNDVELASGTGFCVRKGDLAFLVTNRHNVTGRHQDTDKPLDEKYAALPNRLVAHLKTGPGAAGWIEHKMDLYADPAEMTQPLWREHPTLGGKADFVALPMRVNTGPRAMLWPYDPHRPGEMIALTPTDVVSVVGFPFGLHNAGAGGEVMAIWATGFIATEPSVDHDGLPMMLIDCRSRQGQSGSPVIAYRPSGFVPTEDGNSSVFMEPVYRFLGIYSGRINKESDLGKVWKASAIAELVDTL